MNIDKIKKAIREILSEPGPNGTLSWGRCAATVSLLASIVWVTRLILLNHALPDLSGASAFAIAPYAANKVAMAAQSFSNPTPPTAPPASGGSL